MKDELVKKTLYELTCVETSFNAGQFIKGLF